MYNVSQSCKVKKKKRKMKIIITGCNYSHFSTEISELPRNQTSLSADEKNKRCHFK